MAETRSTEGNQGNGGSRDERVFIFGEDARFRWLMARERILGIPFFTGSVDEAVAETWCGGLVVAPSGPNLANCKSQDDEVLRFAMAGERTGGRRLEVDFGWSCAQV